MNILIIDRNYPGVFEPLVTELVQAPENQVTFITGASKQKITGVNTVIYCLSKNTSRICHPYSKSLEDAAFHGEHAANEATKLKNKGILPDVILGPSTGASMFIKDVFPEVPYICFFDEFYNTETFEVSEAEKVMLKCKNANILVDLYTCDAGIAPSEQLKSQLPKEFHHKIKALNHQEYLGFIHSICAKGEPS